MWSSSSASNSDDFPFFGILYCSSRTQVTAVWKLVNICWNFSHTGWVWLPAPSVAEIPTSIDKFSNRCNLGSRWAIEDPKKRKIIRIWRWRWWSHQIRSNCESIVTQGRYSYLKNCFMQENCVFGHFLQKPSVPNFFSRWFWVVSSKAFQRCMTCQWYILFDLNFVLHHCA